ncbi:hypothetical protein GCM10020221_12190 [Streptomyces thioluteus]|uniref:Transposase n=1 Tax=Streptomyces thioluteus TaxID=66431 RepID=A0ABP6J1X5_STRTU
MSTHPTRMAGGTHDQWLHLTTQGLGFVDQVRETVVIASCEGGRRCRLRPYDRARCALVYLRKHDTLERLVAYAPSWTEALTSHHAAAREHDIVDVCVQLDLEVLADKGHQGAGGTAITPIKHHSNTELADKHKKSPSRGRPPFSLLREGMHNSVGALGGLRPSSGDRAQGMDNDAPAQ